MEQEDDFRCPITGSIYNEPVDCVDGFKYEKSALIKWVCMHKKSPMTRGPLTNKYFTDDDETKLKITKFLEKQHDLQEDLFEKQPIDKLLTYDISVFEMYSVDDLGNYYNKWYENMDEDFFTLMLNFDILNFEQYYSAVELLTTYNKLWVYETISTYKWDINYIIETKPNFIKCLAFNNNEMFKNYLICYEIIPKIKTINTYQYSFLEKNADYLVFLLENGMSPNVIITTFDKILTYAIKKKNEEIFNILVNYKADLSYCAEWGSYLHYACWYGTYAMIKTLLDLKVASTNETSSLWTPIQLILYYQPVKNIIKLIDEYGEILKYNKNDIIKNYNTGIEIEHDLTLDQLMDKRKLHKRGTDEEIEELRIYLNNKIIK